MLLISFPNYFFYVNLYCLFRSRRHSTVSRFWYCDLLIWKQSLLRYNKDVSKRFFYYTCKITPIWEKNRKMYVIEWLWVQSPTSEMLILFICLCPRGRIDITESCVWHMTHAKCPRWLGLGWNQLTWLMSSTRQILILVIILVQIFT